MRKFIIDTDTASDDAVALVMAVMQTNIEVEAITVVAGNVPLQQGIQNALYTLDLCQKNIPVYAGCAKPMLRPLQTAQFVHGTDGMGDIGLPLSGYQPADGHAVDVLRDTINRFAGEITLVTLGPLTNVAVALLREPSLASKVQHCYIMGGIGEGHGNMTPLSEYNIWCDPEAAKIVFESGMKMTMVGWDISWKYAAFSHEQAQDIRAMGTPLAKFVIDIQAAVDQYAKTETQLAGFDLPDPIAMAVAIDPTIAECEELYVEVALAEGLHRGQTIVDVLGMMNKMPNMQVVKRVNRDAFLKMLRQSVSEAGNTK